MAASSSCTPARYTCHPFWPCVESRATCMPSGDHACDWRLCHLKIHSHLRCAPTDFFLACIACAFKSFQAAVFGRVEEAVFATGVPQYRIDVCAPGCLVHTPGAVQCGCYCMCSSGVLCLQWADGKTMPGEGGEGGGPPTEWMPV